MIPGLSIIIPTYNRSLYLNRLLNALTAQSLRPNQIIIVDDHSSDDTKKVVISLQEKFPEIQYALNQGHYQRDGKKTGLALANQPYLGFLDDDIIIEDQDFIKKLLPYLKPDRLIQAKVILENLGYQNVLQTNWRDHIAHRPYPILELITGRFHAGSRPRFTFPTIEFGIFVHKNHAPHLIDDNLIKDAYGESYASSIKLFQKGIPTLLVPELVIRHPGAPSGGSSRFNRMSMLKNFTEFHEGYFYNMIYIHSRYLPAWICLWLPFYLIKSLIALAVNHNLSGWYSYAIIPISKSLFRNFFRRHYV